MYQYFNAITNTKGDALSGYYVAAVDPVTNTNATIYADASGTPISVLSGTANKARVDSDGNVSFFILEGTYHLDIYGPDGVTKVKRISSASLKGGPSGPPGDGITTLSSMTNLSPTDGDAAILTEAGREGLFVFRAGNYTSQVAADTAQNLYVPLVRDAAPGSSGAFVRVNSIPLATLGNYANDTAAASAGVAVSQLYRNGSVLMIRVA